MTVPVTYVPSPVWAICPTCRRRWLAPFKDAWANSPGPNPMWYADCCHVQRRKP